MCTIWRFSSKIMWFIILPSQNPAKCINLAASDTAVSRPRQFSPLPGKIKKLIKNLDAARGWVLNFFSLLFHCEHFTSTRQRVPKNLALMYLLHPLDLLGFSLRGCGVCQPEVEV